MPRPEHTSPRPQAPPTPRLEPVKPTEPPAIPPAPPDEAASGPLADPVGASDDGTPLPASGGPTPDPLVGSVLEGARMRSPSDAELAELVGSLDDAGARHMLRETRRLADAIEARLDGSVPIVAGSPDSETLTVELTRDVYTTDADLGARGGIRRRLRLGDVVRQPMAGLLLERHRADVKVVKA